MTPPLRIGVLGAARIAKDAIVAAARETGDRIVVVAARDPERAAEFAAEHGVERVAATYTDVLTDPDVDLIYNPLPNGLHGPWNLAAIAAGKPVLSEKPFASNAVEARQVRDAAAVAGVTVVEAFHYAHHPLMRRILAIVDSGEIGSLRSVDAVFSVGGPPDDDPRWSLALAGGAFMDLGCYSLHANRLFAPWAGGAPTVVSAKGGERAGRPGVDEWIDAELAFPDGVTGRARCHMSSPDFAITLQVTGSLGNVLAYNFAVPQQDDRLSITVGSETRMEHLGTRASYAYQLEDIRRHLQEEAPVLLDVDDAVAQAELIDDVYRAAGFEPRPVSAI